MPIYAYRCEHCGHAQDFLQKISDPLVDTCPSCGSKDFRKQVTAAGFQLKGGGWYVTDFRDGGKKDAKKAGEGDAKGEDKGEDKRAAAESGSEAKSEGKSEGKADTKSDGKGDAKSGSEADVKPAKPSTPAPASTPSKPTSGGDTKAA